MVADLRLFGATLGGLIGILLIVGFVAKYRTKRAGLRQQAVIPSYRDNMSKHDSLGAQSWTLTGNAFVVLALRSPPPVVIWDLERQGSDVAHP
jgi:hypothetical protein